jgi:hypothetical protein
VIYTCLAHADECEQVSGGDVAFALLGAVGVVLSALDVALDEQAGEFLADLGLVPLRQSDVAAQHASRDVRLAG